MSETPNTNPAQERDRDALRYTEYHEWLAVDGDTVTLGITDYAANQLGDIVFVDAPEAGREVHAGEVIAEIESTKSVGEVSAPFDGTVVESNAAAVDAPETLNSDPFGAGWLVRITPAGDVPDFLDLARYRALTGE